MNSTKCSLREVGSKNAEGRNRFERTHEGIRAANRSDVLGFAKNDGGSSSRQASPAFRDVGRRELPRGVPRPYSKAEFIAKCGDSLRELEETAYWLELLVDSGTVAEAKLSSLRQECDELTAIFVTIIKKSKQSSS